MSAINEQEEFEFRLRQEQEQANQGVETAEPQNQEPKRSLGDYYTRTLPQSAGRQIAGAATAIMHPIQTLKGIGSVGLGAVEKFSPVSMGLKATGVIPRELPHEAAFNDLVNEKVEKYGSLKKLANTAYEDPVGTAMDVLTVAEPFAGTGRSIVKSGVRGTKNLAAMPGAVETAVGAEILPKAMSSIRSRVMSMDPQALAAIGVKPESIEIAKNLKKKFKLNTLPTKTDAKVFFKSVLDEAPEDIQINPNNLHNSIAELGEKLNPADARKINKILNKGKDLVDETDAGLVDAYGRKADIPSSSPRNERLPITKDDYLSLRDYLVDLSESGRNPVGSALKNALDTDAALVIPKIGDAKGIYQLSYEMDKANRYLNNPRSAMSLQSLLERAQKPAEVATQEHLKSLLGPDSELILSDLAKNRGQQGVIGTVKKAGKMAAEFAGIGKMIHLLKG